MLMDVVRKLRNCDTFFSRYCVGTKPIFKRIYLDDLIKDDEVYELIKSQIR